MDMPDDIGLKEEVRRLQGLMSVFTDKLMNANIAIAEWTGKYELHQHRMNVIEEKVDDIRIGCNKDRDDLRDWKKEAFYSFKDEVEEFILTMKSAVDKATDYKRLVLILVAAGFVGAIMGDGMKFVMLILNAAISGR